MRHFGAWLLLAALCLGCTGSAGEMEQVLRLHLADGDGDVAVEAADETRPASWLSAPYAGEICARDQGGVLLLGFFCLSLAQSDASAAHRVDNARGAA